MNLFSIYRSSAGSGKTFTLVKEYLKIVLSSPENFTSVLAITFTNKATDEMKSRIITALTELASGKNNFLLKLLAGETKSDEKEIKKRSGNALKYILHDYSRFSVTTIDSFFTQVMRSVSRELNLPVRYDMDVNTQNAISYVTQKVLEAAGTDRELTHWMTEFLLSRIDDNKGWNIDHQLREFAEELFKENFRKKLHHKPYEIDFSVVASLQKIKKSFETELAETARHFLRIAGEEAMTESDFYYGRGGVYGVMEKASRQQVNSTNLENSRMLKTYHDDKWSSSSAADKSRFESVCRARLKPVLAKFFGIVEREYENYLSSCEALANIFLAGIMQRLDKALSLYRDEYDLMLLMDNYLLLEKFNAWNDASFIYEKTGSRFKNFLIDEFQDTSGLQWKNLLPLVSNGLAEANYSMVVGDVKQAIYRWRSGNMKLLLSGVQRDLKMYESNLSLFELNSNYRSGKNIVAFNNRFFHSLALRISSEYNEAIISDAYHENKIAQQSASVKNNDGYVEIAFIDPGNDSSESGGEEQPNGFKGEALRKTLDIIERLLAKGYRLNHITLLVRNNAEGNEIADFLFSRGYTKIISPDSLLLHHAPQINFLLSVMKYIYDPHDRISLGNALNFLCAQKKSTFPFHASGFLSADETADQFFSRISFFRQLPIYELAEELISHFFGNKKPDAYLLRFLDAVLEFSSKNSSLTGDFLRWWETLSGNEMPSVIMPPSGDALTVMTIHKSKGLQFPAVILPFVNWEIDPKPRSILWAETGIEPFSRIIPLPLRMKADLSKTYFKNAYEEEVALTHLDNLNLLYVAFTRPESALFAIVNSNGKGNNSGKHVHGTLMNDPGWQNSIDQLSGRLVLGSLETTFSTGKEEFSFDHPAMETSQPFLRQPWQSRIFISTQKEKSAAEEGTMMHDLLRRITGNEDYSVVAASVNSSFYYSEEQKKSFNTVLKNLLGVFKARGWNDKSWQVYNESEIVLPDGSLSRPDKVFVKGKEAVILDYKTGVEEASHHMQAGFYRKHLAEMGYHAGAWLYYTKENRIVAVQ